MDSSVRWGDRHHRDLVWFFTESAGDLGLTSSYGPLVDLAMSGIQRSGGNVAQPTRATFDRGSPAERHARILEALRECEWPVLVAYYRSEVHWSLDRIKALPPKDSRAAFDNAPAFWRMLGQLGAVAALLVPRGECDDLWDMLHPALRTRDAEALAAAKELQADGKRRLAALRKRAEESLAGAQAGYAAASHRQAVARREARAAAKAARQPGAWM